MRITIGFYDSQDNLVDNSKIKMKIEDDSRYACVLNTLVNKTAKKVIKYLNEQDGYVRIIAPLYGTNSEFDIKVLCHKNRNVSQ
jgi:hypothetical protein